MEESCGPFRAKIRLRKTKQKLLTSLLAHTMLNSRLDCKRTLVSPIELRMALHITRAVNSSLAHPIKKGL